MATKEDIGSWFGKNIGTILSILAMVISFAVANDRVNNRVDANEKRLDRVESVGSDPLRQLVFRVEKLEASQLDTKKEISEITANLKSIDRKLSLLMCSQNKKYCE